MPGDSGFPAVTDRVTQDGTTVVSVTAVLGGP